VSYVWVGEVLLFSVGLVFGWVLCFGVGFVVCWAGFGFGGWGVWLWCVGFMGFVVFCGIGAELGVV